MLSNIKAKVRYVGQILYQSTFLRVTVFLGLMSFTDIPTYMSIILWATLYYGFLFFRYRWARTFYPSAKTRLLLPLVKLTMDLGMDVGTFATFISIGKRK